MLEDEIVPCPICHNDLHVKIIRISRMSKNITYVVPKDCPNCKSSADKIENMLNRSGKRAKIKTERSYLKVDPRG